MFKPHKMRKVIVAGSSDLLECTIDTLFEQRSLHLMDFGKDAEDFKMGTPMKEAGPSSERLLKLRSAQKVLSLGPNQGAKTMKDQGPVPVDEVEKGLDGIVKKIDVDIMTKWESRNELENQMREIDRKSEDLGPFSEMPLKLEDYEPFQNLALIVGTVRTDPGPDLALKLTGHSYELFLTGHKDGSLVALFVDKAASEEAAKVLLDHDLCEMKPPKGTGYPKAHLANLTAQKETLKQELSDLDAELKELSKQNAISLLASEEHLKIKVEKAEAPLRFATSANAFVIEGFVTETGADHLKNALSKATNDRLYIGMSEPERNDDIPVALKNPSSVRPFEVLTNLVARPKYDEVDPSILLFIGMPLFFGLMLGDVGYAIVLMIVINLGLMTKVFKFLGMEGAAPQLNAILLLCAISSLFFGFLYNEFFGFELFNHSGLAAEVPVVLPMLHYPEFTIPRILVWGPAEFPVVRFDNVLNLLKLTIWIGLAHLFVGLLIGFRNKYVSHGLSHAIFEKGSWLLILTGGVLIFYFLLRDVGGFVHLAYAQGAEIAGLVALIIGCILLIKGEGPMGLIHLPSLISNTMSYARILAIGLSSTGIALAFNNMALRLYDSGGAYIAFAAIVLFLGHFINILLGILGPGLHSLRLHYVEFFTKFYEGGGTPYSPFGMARRFTTTKATQTIAPTAIDTEPKLNVRMM
jgi:V/A-type H+/Na+-transporting ATPase subunit I